MLWEPVDAAEALSARFGFTGLQPAAEWITTQLRATWGIEVDRCERFVISDQNALVWVSTSRGGLVVKWSRAAERFEKLAATTRLLARLAAQGLPVAAPLATLGGRDRPVLDGPLGALSMVVLPELDGTWLDVGDPAAVHAAGASLADLHAALGSSGDAVRLPAPSRILSERVSDWVAGAGGDHLSGATERLGALLPGLPELDHEVQLVHNDFRAANILTRGSTVVGVLDFDEVVVDHCVSDLAKASVYLATRFTDWRPSTPAVRRTFREGYESRRPLSREEACWLDALVLWQGIQAVRVVDGTGWANAL